MEIPNRKTPEVTPRESSHFHNIVRFKWKRSFLFKEQSQSKLLYFKIYQNVNPSTLNLWKIIKDEPKHSCFINHLSEDGKTSNWTSAETGLTGSSFLPWPLAARQNHPSQQLRTLLLAAARLWLGSISASSLTQQRILRKQRAPGGSPGSQSEVVLTPPTLHLPFLLYTSTRPRDV